MKKQQYTVYLSWPTVKSLLKKTPKERKETVEIFFAKRVAALQRAYPTVVFGSRGSDSGMVDVVLSDAEYRLLQKESSIRHILSHEDIPEPDPMGWYTVTAKHVSEVDSVPKDHGLREMSTFIIWARDSKEAEKKITQFLKKEERQYFNGDYHLVTWKFIGIHEVWYLGKNFPKDMPIEVGCVYE